VVDGVVLWGMNNIFTVLVGDKKIECRIKGKVLKDKVKAYNPLTSGDIVSLELDSISETYCCFK